MIKRKSSQGDEEDIDEMVFEAPGGEDSDVADVEEDIADELKKYKERLKVCQKERQEYLDGWQRSKADYLNSKRRFEAEREQETERTAAHFVTKLLPLCDSFDLALEGLKKESGEKSEWRAGIKQIYNQLMTILKSYDVEVLAPMGLPFDPHFHEAVSEVPVTDAARHHIILNVLQNGYAIGERLIRPAKVVVGNYESQTSEKN